MGSHKLIIKFLVATRCAQAKQCHKGLGRCGVVGDTISVAVLKYPYNSNLEKGARLNSLTPG